MSHDSGIDRLEYLDRLPAALSRKQIEVIVGGRRMGKTTLLKQFIKRLMQQGILLGPSAMRLPQRMDS
jgi:uncharacterized protein